MPGGLLANLEVGFEPCGAIHLAAHLTHTPDPTEAARLETRLSKAVDKAVTPFQFCDLLDRRIPLRKRFSALPPV